MATKVRVINKVHDHFVDRRTDPPTLFHSTPMQTRAGMVYQGVALVDPEVAEKFYTGHPHFEVEGLALRETSPSSPSPKGGSSDPSSSADGSQQQTKQPEYDEVAARAFFSTRSRDELRALLPLGTLPGNSSHGAFLDAVIRERIPVPSAQ